VYCEDHLRLHGHECHIRGCSEPLVGDTRVCNNPAHQQAWKQHRKRFAVQSHMSARRVIARRPLEAAPWRPDIPNQVHPAHDEPEGEEHASQYSHYFVAGHFWCVETMMRPCGVVLAWDLWDKSESVSKIAAFIQKHHPTPETKAAYYAIDKGCQLLRHLLISGKWADFRHTSRIIVDAYHYRTHRLDDHLCRTHCNPAPLNGSAPNLVIQETTNGSTVFRRAFNTEVRGLPCFDADC
jgi:hypothetical protein